MTTESHKKLSNDRDKHEHLRKNMDEKIKLNASLKKDYTRAKKKIKILMFERDLLLDRISQMNQHSLLEDPDSDYEAPFAMTTLATRGSRRVTSPLPAVTKNDEITTVPSAPPKRSRVNKLNVKTRRVQPIQRDTHGNPILPQQIGVLTVTNLGRIVTDREAFHNERYIFPVGYTVQRIYPSMVDPTKNTLITSTIIDGGGEAGPKFHVVAADQSNEPIVANSATGAWTVVVRKSNEIRHRDHSNSASGPDYYGFKHPTIAKMIQDLPGARQLKNYLWQNFEEMEPRAAKGVMAAAEKKRDHLEQMGQQQQDSLVHIIRSNNTDRYYRPQEQYYQPQTPYHHQTNYHHHPSTSSSPYHHASSARVISPTLPPAINYHSKYNNTMPSHVVMESDQEIDELNPDDSA